MAVSRCLCWSLKTGTFVAFLVTIFCALLGLTTVILDQIDTSTSFDIMYMFRTEWRMHVRHGFQSINVVMLIAHTLVFVYTLVLSVLYHRGMDYSNMHQTLKFWLLLMLCYILIELGCSLYQYTWYGPNIWHLAYLCFLFLQWLVRFILNVTCLFPVYHRLREIQYDLLFGLKNTGYTPASSTRASTTMLVRNPAFDKNSK